MQDRYFKPVDIEFIEPQEELDTRIREATFRVEIAKKVSSNSLWVCEQAFARSPLSATASSLSEEDYNQVKKIIIHALQYALRWVIHASLVNHTELLLDSSVRKTLRAVYEWLGEPFVVTVQLMKESIVSVAGERAGTELSFYLDYIAQVARTDLKYQPTVTSYELKKPNAPQVESFPEHDVTPVSRSIKYSFMESVFRQGDRIITFAAGAAFLGSLIAQVPGSIVGAVTGVILSFLFTTKNVRSTENR